jgi:HB1/ASXL restriction endonuclease-like protein with HTH domain
MSTTSNNTDDTLRVVLANRIEDLREQRADAVKQLTETRKRITVLGDQIEQLSETYRTQLGQEPPRGSWVVIDFAPLTWGDAMAFVLAGSGVPMHVAAIWERMSEGGFVTNSADPKRTMASVATRDPRFVREGKNTFGLAEWPPSDPPRHNGA